MIAIARNFQKTSLISAISVLVIGVKKDEMILAKILYIYYLPSFEKNKKNKIQALINCNSKINAIILVYILKVGVQV